MIQGIRLAGLILLQSAKLIQLGTVLFTVVRFRRR